MDRRTYAITLASFLSFAAACGDSSETSAQGGSTGAAGGAAEGGSGGGEAPGPTCRTYAAEYNFSSSLGASYDYFCTHGEAGGGFDLICAQGGALDTVHWDSKGAFIDEAKALGLLTRQTFTRDIGSIHTSVYQYDDQGRLERIFSDGELLEQNDAWDEQGRHTHGVTFYPQCAGMELVATYDDVARTVTRESTGMGACFYRHQTTYDEDFLPTRTDYEDGAVGIYTTTQKTTVCRD
jgi:hypothetical protein